jgi:glycosyltransferase involved in cell wall biosynthesis
MQRARTDAAAPGEHTRMKILVAHNTYLHRGGEDAVAEAEVELLRSRGHEVIEYRRRNEDLADIGRLQAAADTLWSRRTTRELGALLRTHQPALVHVHNTFPLISPSLYWAAAAAGVPVVQTLHNFRLLCPQAMLLREGRVCEDCVGHSPLAGVRHGCYRGSRPQTAVLGGMLVLHRALGTWQHKVSRFIALNEFCRAKFIEGGLPADRVVVKPNFVDLPAPPDLPRSGLLFVGRLAPEKGVAVLADAARGLLPDTLRVAGSGPEAGLLDQVDAITALGALSPQLVAQEMSRALALVVPSLWYENFPRILVEAFACGLPVLASRLGALAELVEDGMTGLLFEPGNAGDLAAKMKWAVTNPARMAEMGRNARALYEQRYSAAANYVQLAAIYREAIASNASEPAY